MFTPKQLVILLLLLMAAGCKSVVKQSLTTPPSPLGPSGPPAAALAVSRAAFVAPPPPSVPVTLGWSGGPGQGSYAVQGSSNLVDWVTQTNVPATTNEYQVTVPGYPIRFWRAGVQMP